MKMTHNYQDENNAFNVFDSRKKISLTSFSFQPIDIRFVVKSTMRNERKKAAPQCYASL